MHKNEMSVALKEAYESGYKHGSEDERNECAKLCDKEVEFYDKLYPPPESIVPTYDSGMWVMAENLANAIRARGEVK